MGFVIAIVSIVVVWSVLIVILETMSRTGYPPEMNFPETEWPEMTENHEPLPAKNQHKQ